MASHEMPDGRLQVDKRGPGRYRQCAARVGGKRFRSSASEERLDRAKRVAEQWYLDLRVDMQARRPAKRKNPANKTSDGQQPSL